MEEVNAKNFDVYGIEKDATPISVRLLPKNPGTHIKEVPDTEWSVYISSSWNISLDEWKALAKCLKDAGFNAKVSGHEKGIAVW